jgi:hypothetical protein
LPKSSGRRVHRARRAQPMSPVLALLRFLFPLGGALAGGRRLFARLYALVCVSALAALAALAASGPVGALLPLAAWALAVAVALVAGGIIMRAAWFRRDRGAWLLIGFGMADWALGWAMWTARYLHTAGPPPSLSFVDLVWLPTLPLVYLGIGGLVSTELQGVRRALLLDGLIVGGQPLRMPTSSSSGRSCTGSSPRIGRRPRSRPASCTRPRTSSCSASSPPRSGFRGGGSAAGLH